MKRSLVGFLACPVCLGDLDLRTVARTKDTGDSQSAPPDQESREPEIIDGLLVCFSCGRWYPIRNFLAELLPDHLRDWGRDLDFLRSLEPWVGAESVESLSLTTAPPARQSSSAQDAGLAWKMSEMTIVERVDDPGFFGPGDVSPFNPGNPGFTNQLIRRFGNALFLLELKAGGVVLDVGAGYAWTSEWLMRSGFVPIGIDICRTYLDIGVRRMRGRIPHLLVADVENLPLKSGCLDAVLCYDAFHHVPDRKRAMQQFFRAMTTPGRVVLAEPGAGHETEPSAVEAMRRYGILEKGMSLHDVAGYCRGIAGAVPEEHHIFRTISGTNPRACRPAWKTILKSILFAVISGLGCLGAKVLPEKISAYLFRSLHYADCHFYVVRKQKIRS